VQAQSEKRNTDNPAFGLAQEWLGNSVWRAPDVQIQRTKSWPSVTAITYRRGSGEATWRGDRHRLVLTPDELPSVLYQVEHGHIRQTPPSAPGTPAFYPAGLTLRTVQPEARFVQVVWDTDSYSALLPELGAATPRFEFLYQLKDPLLSQIAWTMSQEIEGGFADRLLVESLDTALCICLAKRFAGHLPLPTSKGLSPERLRRVRDYVAAHLDEDLSLTVLADIACLSPYHFSRSFKKGHWGRTAALRHAAPDRAREDFVAPDQSARCPDRARARLHRIRVT
jgi:AraC family transcriptional regulator